MNKEIMEKVAKLFPNNSFVFGNALELVNMGRCPLCGVFITQKDKDNMNELSRKEYKISKICQKCQDKIFK
jgi:uncharacterized protein with PIN domain